MARCRPRIRRGVLREGAFVSSARAVSARMTRGVAGQEEDAVTARVVEQSMPPRLARCCRDQQGRDHGPLKRGRPRAAAVAGILRDAWTTSALASERFAAGDDRDERGVGDRDQRDDRESGVMKVGRRAGCPASRPEQAASEPASGRRARWGGGAGDARRRAATTMPPTRDLEGGASIVHPRRWQCSRRRSSAKKRRRYGRRERRVPETMIRRGYPNRVALGDVRCDDLTMSRRRPRRRASPCSSPPTGDAD